MKTLLISLLLFCTGSVYGGMGVSHSTLGIQLRNDSDPADSFTIRHKDPVYQLVNMSAIRHFTKSVYKAPTYSANTMDCDDLTMIFLGELNRYLHSTDPATSGGYAIGEVYSFNRTSGAYHVDPIVVTNIGTYVIMAETGAIIVLRDYQRIYNVERVRI